MPCAMMHLACAMNYDSKAEIGFYLGILSPDCIDIREFKDKNHLRLYTVEDERKEKLFQLAKSYDLNDVYQFGVIFHLFTDMVWDFGPMAEHKKLYKGGDWFRDYRNDIRDISRYMYANLDWAKKMWDDLCSAPIEHLSTIELYPADRIRSYLEYNRMRHALPGAVESINFPHEKMMDFCQLTANLFKDWLKDNNLI